MTALGTISGGTIADSGDIIVSAAFRAAMMDESQPRTYLVEMSVASEIASVIEPETIAGTTLADGAVCGGADNGSGGVAIVYFSDTGHITFPTDDDPNREYEGRAAVPLVIERSVSLTPETRADGSQTGSSTFEDGDGAVGKYVAGSAVDGRNIRVLAGPKGGAYNDFSVIFNGQGVGWIAEEDRVRLEIRDNAYILDSVLQSELYAGTGSEEGDSTLTGIPKPLVFGKCLNITPILIDAANLIYQVHDGAVEAISAVYDRGAALSLNADRANYAALAAGVPGGGNFDTCIAEGYIKLGGSPDGQITADVEGDKTGGDYAENTAEIVRRMMSRAGVTSTYLAEDTFTTLAEDISAVAGLFFDRAVTTRDAINTSLSGIGASWWVGRDGRIRVGRLSPPKIINQVVRLTVDEIIDIRQVAMPSSVWPPNWRRRVGYQKAWTVQPTDIAAAVSDARKHFLATEWRVQTSADATVKTLHPLATDPDPVPSYLDDSTDAADLAAFLLGLFSPERRYFAVTIKSSGHLVDIFDSLLVIHPRFGLANGKAFRCVGIREDCERTEVTLFLWG